ncbi:hypothetical protein MLD38_032892 [Melastoma candidum]|uniref:Uncharacterized protein n=1 Tax=Melastoma candidum TaxID=119954 RepID=A0ACB9M554_9MYRT|nr:hypothetical protein MLD38_032892 [Melastoma candidum]
MEALHFVYLVKWLRSTTRKATTTHFFEYRELLQLQPSNISNSSSELQLAAYHIHGGDLTEAVLSLFQRLGCKVWEAVEASGSRSESRLWLCKTVSLSTSLSPDEQRRLFVKVLREETIGRELAPDLVRMVFMERPRMAASVLARRSRVLEKFFRGNPRRVLEWFSNFDAAGG